MDIVILPILPLPDALRLLNKICGALKDLVAFVQFKKCEKHLWRSINFNSKVAG